MPLTVLIRVLEESGQFGDAGPCKGVAGVRLQHTPHYTCVDTFIKQGYRRRCANEVPNRFLEFVDQARFVWCQGTELHSLRTIGRRAESHGPTSLMTLISSQLLEEVVSRWNSWGASTR